MFNKTINKIKFLIFFNLIFCCVIFTDAQEFNKENLPGIYYTENIVSSSRPAWKLFGSGKITAGWNHPWISSIRGQSTIIVHKGDDVLLSASGAHWQIKNLVLLGFKSMADSKKGLLESEKSIGIKVYNTNRSYGGTGGVISGVSLAGFDAGVELGMTGKNGNDNTCIRDCYISRCNDAIRIDAMQAVNTNCFNLNIGFCKTIVHAAHGGCFNLIGLDTGSDQTLLHVTGSGFYTAENNGYFSFQNIRVDNRGTNSIFEIVRAGNKKARYTVSVYDLRMPAPGKGKGLRATLTSKSQKLYLRLIHNIPQNTVFDPGSGMISISDSVLPKHPKDFLPIGSTGKLYITNCFYQGNQISGVFTR